jgi:hypothetical protein
MPLSLPAYLSNLKCLCSRVFCRHGNPLNTQLRQIIDILFPQNVKWGNNYLDAILFEEEGHPECKCFSRPCRSYGNNVLVVFEDGLDHTDLPETGTVA